MTSFGLFSLFQGGLGKYFFTINFISHQGPKKGKGGKGKLSKAEKERIKKEEAEQRAREEGLESF